MTVLEQLLRGHAFTRGLPAEYFGILLGCGRKYDLPVGAYLWRQGEECKEFYLIGSGEVAIGITIPHQGQLQVDRVGAGDVVGWSWLVAPHQSHFDARTVTPVAAVALDASCLRRFCEIDREFGCELLSRIAPIIVRRLEASQKRIIELQNRYQASEAWWFRQVPT